MLADQARIARMERGFAPRNIAVIGGAKHNDYRWVRAHLPFQEGGFGKVFNVNINRDEWAGSEALGVKTYASILDIPEPIDYVTVTVPAKPALNVLQECIKRDVAVVHFFTAGFSDEGTPEGLEREKALSQLLKDANTTVLIGPNCVGLHNPARGIRQAPTLEVHGAGALGYIAQSGSQSIGFVAAARQHGMSVSKAFSMGNGVDIDVHDYVDYLVQDDDTRVIGMYVEGTRNPRQFFKSLQAATRKKPVLVWKVGTTVDAARATQAHTGSAFMPEQLWNSLLTRCGATSINNLDEMLSSMKLLLHLPPAMGYRAGLVAATGGHSTEMANVFSRAGFDVVPLSTQSHEELRSFLNSVGGSFRNPIEGGSLRDPEAFARTINVLQRDENIDVIAVEVPAPEPGGDMTFLESRIASLKALRAESRKPLLTVITTTFPYQMGLDEKISRRFVDEGIPACINFDAAAASLKKVADYYVASSYLGG